MKYETQAFGSTKQLRILFVGNSEDDTVRTGSALRRAGYQVVFERVDDPPGMRATLRTPSWDVVLCDYQMPRFDPIAALELLKRAARDIPFIMYSGVMNEYHAVDVFEAGAYDFVIKGDMGHLVQVIESAVGDAVTV